MVLMGGRRTRPDGVPERWAFPSAGPKDTLHADGTRSSVRTDAFDDAGVPAPRTSPAEQAGPPRVPDQ